MSETDADAIVAAFDDHEDATFAVADVAVLQELRAAAAARREAEGRIEAAVLEAHTVSACRAVGPARSSG